jgi:hypothetical protein
MTHHTRQSNRVENSSSGSGSLENLRIFRERIPMFREKFEFGDETYSSEYATYSISVAGGGTPPVR